MKGVVKAFIFSYLCNTTCSENSQDFILCPIYFLELTLKVKGWTTLVSHISTSSYLSKYSWHSLHTQKVAILEQKASTRNALIPGVTVWWPSYTTPAGKQAWLLCLITQFSFIAQHNKADIRSYEGRNCFFSWSSLVEYYLFTHSKRISARFIHQ